MKGLLLAGVLLIFLAGGYYFRSSFFQTAIDRGLYQYTLQCRDLDQLHRFAPLMEAQMQRLTVLADVSSEPQFNGPQAIVSGDHQVQGLPVSRCPRW